MYKHILRTLKIKGGITLRVVRKDLEKRKRNDFEIEKRKVVRVSNETINWSRFEAKNLRFSTVGESNRNSFVSIVLDGGVVDGDLVIDGAGQSVDKIKFINCRVSGEILIHGVEARKLTIAARAGSLKIVDSDIKDVHICGQIEDDISLMRLKRKDSIIEINGSSKIVRLREVKGSQLKFETFNSDLINGKGLDFEDFYLPTDHIVNLKRINFDKLYFLKEGNEIGLAYDLVNAKIEFRGERYYESI